MRFFLFLFLGFLQVFIYHGQVY